MNYKKFILEIEKLKKSNKNYKSVKVYDFVKNLNKKG